MMNMIDDIKYLAKFPLKAGTLKNFSRTTEKTSGYTDLKTYMQGIEGGTIPELQDFIWGTDDKVIMDRLRNFKSYFMLVEHGNIVASNYNNARIRQAQFNIAITIAHPFSDNSLDPADELLISQACLGIVKQLVDEIEKDDAAKCNITRMIESGYNIDPVFPAAFFQNIGWVLSFKQTQSI